MVNQSEFDPGGGTDIDPGEIEDGGDVEDSGQSPPPTDRPQRSGRPPNAPSVPEGSVEDISEPATNRMNTRRSTTGADRFGPDPAPTPQRDIGDDIVPGFVERGLGQASDAVGGAVRGGTELLTTPIREGSGFAVEQLGGNEQVAESTFDRVAGGITSDLARTPFSAASAGIEATEAAGELGRTALTGDVDETIETTQTIVDQGGPLLRAQVESATSQPFRFAGTTVAGGVAGAGASRLARTGISRARSGSTSGRSFLDADRAQLQPGSQRSVRDIDTSDLPDEIADTQPNPSPRTTAGGSRGGRRGGRGGGSRGGGGPGGTRGGGSRRGRDRSLSSDVDDITAPADASGGSALPFRSAAVGSALTRLEDAQASQVDVDDSIMASQDDTTVSEADSDATVEGFLDAEATSPTIDEDTVTDTFTDTGTSTRTRPTGRTETRTDTATDIDSFGPPDRTGTGTDTRPDTVTDVIPTETTRQTPATETPGGPTTTGTPTPGGPTGSDSPPRRVPLPDLDFGGDDRRRRRLESSLFDRVTETDVADPESILEGEFDQ